MSPRTNTPIAVFRPERGPGGQQVFVAILGAEVAPRPLKPGEVAPTSHSFLIDASVEWPPVTRRRPPPEPEPTTTTQTDADRPNQTTVCVAPVQPARRLHELDQLDLEEGAK